MEIENVPSKEMIEKIQKPKRDYDEFIKNCYTFWPFKKKQFLKDLPIYLNGFAVGMLLWDIPKISVLNISMCVLAWVTFIWYGKNKQSGGGNGSGWTSSVKR